MEVMEMAQNGPLFHAQRILLRREVPTHSGGGNDEAPERLRIRVAYARAITRPHLRASLILNIPLSSVKPVF